MLGRGFLTRLGGPEHPRVVRSAADLDVGKSGVIEQVVGRGSTSIRLLEMGLVPGTRVRLVKRAPLGDPLQLQVRGFYLSLRAAEAALLKLGASA